MKKILGLFLGLATTLNVAAQDDVWEEEETAPNQGLPSTMFSVEGGYHYNGFNEKHSIGVKSYVWFLKRNSIGPEFHMYFPSEKRDYMDYQVDFNFRRIVVDYHPLSFDVLIGPAFRSTLDVYDENGKYVEDVEATKRDWLFDGVNIGFGVGYRKGNHTMFLMPKINHKDAKIQVSAGYKYHFDPILTHLFNNKYKLKKKRRKS